VVTPEELIERARGAAAAAYAPYSGLQVGAVAVAEDGRVFHGANVENAAFSSTMCAEAVAVASAIGAGADSIETVAVVARDGRATPPCGNCRQIMSEFGVTRVVLESDDGDATVFSFGDFLPHSFASDRIVPPSQG